MKQTSNQTAAVAAPELSTDPAQRALADALAGLPELRGAEREQFTRDFLASYADGAAKARARCAAILRSEAAVGRESLAHHCAFETDMPVAEALALLNASAASDGSTTGDRSGFAAHAARVAERTYAQRNRASSVESDGGRRRTAAEIFAQRRNA